ncbi:hypothetical protein EX30DRAFT_347185 [Ascodesmis nigricans]|uniref:Pentacotripeptide-repeat region of PRORP domain-containing protein n=1 Tax=Ascodesmis nigricans TaxID=341454 RepID=A0A4S2N111_9PEZI|nr:hypothetical protein EX30DRAFT_347185 [Ascodesmis nigricans]
MRPLLKGPAAQSVCLQCASYHRFYRRIAEYPLSFPHRRHASTETSTTIHQDPLQTPRFTIRRPRPYVQSQPRKLRAFDKPLPAARVPQTSETPEQSTRNKISYEEAEAFCEALDPKRLDIHGASRLIEDFVARGATVLRKSYHPLTVATGKFLEALLLDCKDESGLPGPVQFIDWCIKIGLRPHAHFEMLLIHAISQEMPVEEVYHLFETAARLRVGYNDNDELVFDPIYRNPFLNSKQSSKDGRVIFMTYVYLRMNGHRFTGPMADVDTQLHRLTRPDIVESIEEIAGLLPNHLSSEVSKVASELLLRSLLSDPHALRLRLSRYTERNDLKGLRSFYHSLRALEPSPLLEQHYAAIIASFGKIWRSREIVLEVWDDMNKLGIEPMVGSWTSLLRCSKNFPSKTALKDVWNKMIEAGVAPDAHSWTTLITLQLERGEIAEGLQSFDSMVAAGTIPDVKTINAVVSRLISQGSLKFAAHALTVAGSLGITPDVATFNLIIQDYFQRGDFAGAIDILKGMVEHKVEPDHATFTILVKGFELNKANLPTIVEDQGEDISVVILRFMKQLGFPPRVHVYTALLQYLLDQDPIKHDVIAAVLRRMWKDKVKPNARTYTVLIDAAFKRGDLRAVNEFWTRIKTDKVWCDHILWTEMILGFAEAGDMLNVRDLLDELQEYNKNAGESVPRVVITLGGYYDILLAVERRGELGLARRIAEDVVGDWNSRLVIDSHWKGGPAEENWWNLVRTIGGPAYAAQLQRAAEKAPVIKSQKAIP